MSTRRVLVCGSRDYPDRDEVFRVLDVHLAKLGPRMMVVTGGARGADEYAREWAVSRKVDHWVMYARWGIDGKAAGPIRNRRMVKKKIKLVLAFSRDFDKSRGTSDMIRVAEKLGIKVRKFH